MHGSQKQVSDSLELELRMEVLGAELRSPEPVIPRPSLQPNCAVLKHEPGAVSKVGHAWLSAGVFLMGLV